ETDIREYVIRRKISGGTRSDAGRRARDMFVGLKKTCRKLGVSFWQYLLCRLRKDRQIPPLPDLI
ncbi:MAG: transposase, partial [Elainellaceae cyanobacterium]